MTHPVTFGIVTGQHHLSWKQVRQQWHLAEEVGFDHLYLFDHFTGLYDSQDGDCLEASTLLAALAGETENAKIGVLVYGNTHRHPAILAKEIVTVDHLSEGRALLGIGTHTFHKRLKLWGWPLRSRRIPRDEPAESAAIGVERVPGNEAPSASAYVLPDEIERKALAARLLRLAEQHIAASERAAASLEAQAPGDRAEDARAIAGLVRVVRAMSGVTRAKREHADEPDDPAFRSLEELGRAISAHLEAMESGAAGDVYRETEGG